MPDGFTDTPSGDDTIDFRPQAAQPAPRKPAPLVRTAASDGIDFQPSMERKPSRFAAAQSDEIDFQPAEKPATFESLYGPQQSSVSLTDRAARVGEPSPLVRSFAPKAIDATQLPRNPVTNEFIGPGMATEEEKAARGTISAREQTTGERLLRMLGAGAPAGSKVAEWTGQPGTKDNLRLFAPEQLMTEAEQQRHPILTGAGEFTGGMTSPESLALIGLTAGAGELAGPGGAVAKRLLSAGFSIPMLVNAARMTPEISDAFRRGDTATGERLLTQAVLQAGTAGLAGRGMFEEAPSSTLPAGTVGPKVALDEALSRGDRRLQDFVANQAARVGMGNLADAERGLEADRQARTNAPVDIPRTYEGPTPILSGRAAGPERNPLEVEADHVREERQQRPPDFRVMDLRRVVPENPEQPPYYEIGQAERTASDRAVEPAPAGETIGAGGRTATMADLAARTLPKIENSLQQRFEPDVLEEARQELNNAAGLAGSFERPGRYFAEWGDQNEYMPSRSTSAAKGVHAGGVWYGVTSARPMIEDMHPWFRGVAEGPETFARTVKEGSGAAYDRLLEAAATHIQNERESARPIVDEFAPQLRSLAGQVRDIDPDLAETLESLAKGKSVGFGNLREYIEGKIHDAETAAEFSRAIEEAADEARNAAGAAETTELGSAAREEGRGLAESPSESARSIDFEPFPEAEPINPQEVEDMSRLLGRRVTAEELPEIRRRLDAERNISEGLRGNRRDAAGEIREEHRRGLDPGGVSEEEAAPPRESSSANNRQETIEELTRQIADLRDRGQVGTDEYNNAWELRRQLREERRQESSAQLDAILGQLKTGVRSIADKHYAETVPLTARMQDLGESLSRAAKRESGVPGGEKDASLQTERDYESVGNRLGLEFRGVMGADAGLGDRAVVTYQDPVSRGSIGIRVGEWSPEKVEQRLAEKREELGPGERYSGVSPRALTAGARALQRVWEGRIARPFLDRVAKIGDKYTKAQEAHPAVAEGLHLLDNAPQYLRAKAAQEVHNIIGNLSRAQERLFTLMADADSRENLKVNHPEDYAEAQRDPAISAALKRYRPIEQELTRLRQKMGGEVLDRDYLKRVYEKYVAGVGKAEAPNTPERGTSAFDRVIRPQRTDKLGREATAEYHYEHGLHEFGPSFATKFIGTHLRALRDQIAGDFMNEATFVGTGASEPRFILYRGERYYRPDVAREMRDGGAKGVREYDRYDPTAGEKFPVPAEGRFLGPRELVKSLVDFGRREESEPGAVRRFFQEQILGFGFGVPHMLNIMRRVSQSVPGGAVNPKGWLEAWRVALSKELRDRGVAGLNDPTFDKLAQRGSIPTSDMARLREYWGGNLNPANWLRKMATVGHKALFEPGSLGGFGGLDQRARVYIADLIKSQRPELTDTEIARAVRDQLGDYNRANWSDRQKTLARFMMFPGWDFSSIRWVLQHPVKTTVPPALLTLLANQTLHQLGANRSEDKYDVQNIHIGDRAYGSSLIRESVARNLFRPALAYAESKVRGENDQRAMAAASRGVTAGAGGLLSMLRPDLSGFLALATNRQGLFSSKEIVGKDDYSQPGAVLPSRAIEKQAVFALRQAVPALGRMLDSNEDFDLRAFAGGNLGTPNYRDDAEKRLIRNEAEAAEVHSTIGKLAKARPELAREYVKDPDNAAYALFFHDLNGLVGTLKRMDETKQRIESSGLSDSEKMARIANVEKARENLLQHADGLNNLLFERRQKSRPANGVTDPSWMMRALRSGSRTEAQP